MLNVSVVTARSDLEAGLDAVELIPGNLELLYAIADVLEGLSKRLDGGASAMKRIDVDEWTGPAADAFHLMIDLEPKKWAKASDAMGAASDVLTRFTEDLQSARRQAWEARVLWQQGEAATSKAEANYDQEVSDAPSPFAVPTFEDPGASKRDSAVALLESARSSVQSAGAEAAAVLKLLASSAPDKHWWEDAGDTAGDVGRGFWNHGVVPTVNGLAAVGQSAMENPGNLAEMGIGAGLLALGTAGSTGGGLATATGIGAPAGVPVLAASIAAVGAGGALVAGGAQGLLGDAMNKNPNILQALSKDQRLKDSGYGKTPVRSPDAPEPPPNAGRYDPDVAGRVGGWGEVDGKTRGVLVKNGEESVSQSGNAGPASTMPGGPGSGLNGALKSHVEAHAGASLKPGEEGTLYLNRAPCTKGMAGGCDAMLPRFVPEGAKFTVYGPDDFVRVVKGIGR
jgi:hypothetical protein